MTRGTVDQSNGAARACGPLGRCRANTIWGSVYRFRFMMPSPPVESINLHLLSCQVGQDSGFRTPGPTTAVELVALLGAGQ